MVEVLSHTFLALPQAKDIPLPPGSSQTHVSHSKKRKKKNKDVEKPSTTPYHGSSAGVDGERSGGVKNPENASARRWNWTSLADSSVSSHPPIFTRDGSHFFSVVGSTVKIHSTSSGKVVSVLPRSRNEGHTDIITSATLCAQNAFQLITASLDGTIKFWDFLEGHLLRTIDIAQPIHHICVHEKLKDQVVVSAEKVKKTESTPQSGSKPRKKSKAEEELTVVLCISFDIQAPGGAAQTQKPSRFLAVGKTRKTCGLAFSASGERLIAVAGHKAYVAKTADLKSGFTKFVSPEALTCFAVHPSDEYFATGDVKGVVRLWYCPDPNQVNVVGVAKKSQTSTLHWHAHAVSSVAFTKNGAYLLSGGEEAVLVIWQLHSGKREFVPRVGAPIKDIVVPPPKESGEEYLLGLADSSYAFVSAATLKLSRVFAGIKLDPFLSASSSSTPLAFHSLSETLVLPSSHPSSLQTYSPSSFSLIAELEVSPSNRVSRRDEKMLEPSRVERAVISSTGEWMATIDRRKGDEHFRGEIYLKFWYWDKKNAFWILNTRIDRPHALRDVSSMSFGPDSLNTRLVTTGEDGNVKAWRPRKTRDRKGNEEVSWVPRSSFGFKSDIPRHASWSPDGSLLAVAVGSTVALYDPETNVPLQILVCRECQRPSRTHFAGPSGRFLVVVGGVDLVVWDIMSRSVLWHVKNNLPYEALLPHPHRYTFLTTHASPSNPLQAVVTIFHARSPTPQMECTLPFAARSLIWYPQSTSVCDGSFSVVGLTHDHNVVLMGDGVGPQGELGPVTKTLQKGPVAPRRSLFEDMFGVPALTELSVQHSRDQEAVTTLPWRSSETAEFFDAPSHLIPPINTFFGSLVDSFLRLRMDDEDPPAEEDDVQPDPDSNMLVDELPDLSKPSNVLADDVLSIFVPVFKDVAESTDYPDQAGKTPASPKTAAPSAKSHKPARPHNPQLDAQTPKRPPLPGPTKAGKKRNRSSLD